MSRSFLPHSSLCSRSYLYQVTRAIMSSICLHVYHYFLASLSRLFFIMLKGRSIHSMGVKYTVYSCEGEFDHSKIYLCFSTIFLRDVLSSSKRERMCIYVFVDIVKEIQGGEVCWSKYVIQLSSCFILLIITLNIKRYQVKFLSIEDNLRGKDTHDDWIIYLLESSYPLQDVL